MIWKEQHCHSTALLDLTRKSFKPHYRARRDSDSSSWIVCAGAGADCQFVAAQRMIATFPKNPFAGGEANATHHYEKARHSHATDRRRSEWVSGAAYKAYVNRARSAILIHVKGNMLCISGRVANYIDRSQASFAPEFC